MPKKFLRLGASVLLVAGACSSAPSASKSQTSSPEVVARVGDDEITLEEVDQRALADNMRAFQELYNVRREALQQLIDEALLEQEAASRGMSREELIEAEIAPAIEPVGEDDVEQFYEQNRSRLGGRTLEQIGDQIRSFLAERAETVARESFLEKLRKEASVAISLDPPRIPVVVANGERIKGPDDAKVTIIEYSDFQ